VREGAIVPGLDGWLASLFYEEHLDHTCEVLAGSDGLDPAEEDRQTALREQIRSCDQRLERYRALLDEGEAIATVAKWIAEVERERKAAQGTARSRGGPAASSRSRRPERWSKPDATLSMCWPRLTRRTRRSCTRSSVSASRTTRTGESPSRHSRV
jgi:hypothetical protein